MGGVNRGTIGAAVGEGEFAVEDGAGLLVGVEVLPVRGVGCGRGGDSALVALAVLDRLLAFGPVALGCCETLNPLTSASGRRLGGGPPPGGSPDVAQGAAATI